MTGQPVQAVVTALGPALVTGTSGDLSRPVSSVRTSDPQWPTSPEPGLLLLAVGYDLEGPAWTELAAAADVVVVKGRTAPVVEGTTVLALDPAADWSHVAALMRTAISASEPAETASLFDVAEAVAAVCGGPVVLHDASWQLLAYSGGQPEDEVRNETILGRRAPLQQVEGLRRAGVVSRLQAGEVVHVAGGDVAGLQSRWAVGISVGGELLGTIWLVAPDATDQAATEDALRRAAGIATLPLLRKVTAELGVEAEHDAAFESLLAGAGTVRAVAERLGVPVTASFVLAALTPSAAEQAERVASVRRLRMQVRTFLDAFRARAALATLGESLYVLLPADGSSGRAGALRVLGDLHANVQRGLPHRAVVSSTVEGLADVVAARHTVDGLVALSERRGWTGLTDSDRVEASWRLEQFREVAREHPELLQGRVMRVVEYDREQHGELLDTLRRWFECGGDSRLTADRMGLHANTVRYRLRRVQEIADVSLDDPDERLLAELQVRLLQD